MLLVQHFKYHVFWICLAALAVGFGSVWHAWVSHDVGRWVGGSSVVGLTLGSIAAAIILFELLLWPRKRLRRYKLGKTKTWMAAHLWLGLATGPLAVVHAGYRFGGAFTTTLMILLLIVLASGLYGWFVQTVLPRWMLRNLPAETIVSQIDQVSQQAVRDARAMLTVACGAPLGVTLPPLEKDFREEMEAEPDATKTIVIGAVREHGGLRGRTLITTTVQVALADAEKIWRQYASTIEPFLLHGRRRPGLLSEGQRADQWFSLLRSACSLTSETVIDRLEDLCDQRRQFDIQRRVHGWLHGWIAFHAAISILLGILLVAHIVLALRYW